MKYIRIIALIILAITASCETATGMDIRPSNHWYEKGKQASKQAGKEIVSEVCFWRGKKCLTKHLGPWGVRFFDASVFVAPKAWKAIKDAKNNANENLDNDPHKSKKSNNIDTSFFSETTANVINTTAELKQNTDERGAKLGKKVAKSVGKNVAKDLLQAAALSGAKHVYKENKPFLVELEKGTTGTNFLEKSDNDNKSWDKKIAKLGKTTLGEGNFDTAQDMFINTIKKVPTSQPEFKNLATQAAKKHVIWVANLQGQRNSKYSKSDRALERKLKKLELQARDLEANSKK